MDNDSLLVMKACSFYNTYFEFLLDIELEKIQAIKRAWDDEKQSVLTEATKGTVKQIDMKYYVQIVGLLERIKRDNFGLYRGCTDEMKRILAENKEICKRAGLIVKDDDYSNTEYFVNYLYAAKALDKIKSKLSPFGKK
ncbi:MAG: hypothetical protein Q4C44_04535 [bacterium]|nr:hypothetical protein [bacterium]